MRPPTRLRLAACIAALVASAAGLVAAQPVAPTPTGVLGVSLKPGWRTADGRHVGAVEVRLAPGWHTYWRVPGASGIPPHFDWSASANLASVAYEWPRPIVFDTLGVPTIGYKNALLLPVILTPQSADGVIEATVDLFFGVCNDICIPAEARLTARFDPSADGPDRAAIERALADRPTNARAAGVTDAWCTITPRGDGHTIAAEIAFQSPPGPGMTAVIEAEGRPDLWIAAAESWTEGRSLHATARVDALGPGGVILDRRDLRFTLLDGARAIDIRGCTGG